MADEKLNLGPEGSIGEEPPVGETPDGTLPPEAEVPETPEEIAPPGPTEEVHEPELPGSDSTSLGPEAVPAGDAPAEESLLGGDATGEHPAPGAEGEVVVPFEKISELISQRNKAARDAVGQGAAPAGHNQEGLDKSQEDTPADTTPKRRGRKPKEAGKDKDTPAGKVRDKRGKEAPEQSSPGGGAAVAPTVEGGSPTGDTTPPSAAVEENTAPPRPVEDQKVVYLKISEMHPFHTYRQHPFSVRDDAKMQETVASIKLNGVMVPGLARPEKDGNGYEIIAGHRRCRGSELAGLDEMPFIVREMTDHEAVQAMKDSNKQRDGMLPMEMARLLDLEMEDIKHQGVALKNVPEGDIGKRSAEIVGEAHGMNYKKVMRYIRLNSLVPELQDMVDGTAVNANGEPMKKLGFIPAVELSYIRPKNQQLIAVSIEGEQATPSVSQAKKLRELDQSGKLTGDVIDAILSEEKREVGQVIISTDELSKYFGKEITPRQMKDQIIALLDEWKEKQPPEKKAEVEK